MQAQYSPNLWCINSLTVWDKEQHALMQINSWHIAYYVATSPSYFTHACITFLCIRCISNAGMLQNRLSSFLMSGHNFETKLYRSRNTLRIRVGVSLGRIRYIYLFTDSLCILGDFHAVNMSHILLPPGKYGIWLIFLLPTSTIWTFESSWQFVHSKIEIYTARKKFL